jgi:glyoxylase-like metal-dependent hydrolase (beta-lactamase superfamily II)
MRPTTALLALAIFLAGCGHVIRHAPNHHGAPFDFASPPCARNPDEPLPAGQVGVRYLGSGGVAIEWGGSVVLVGPYFSNYGLSRVVLGRLSPDLDAIRAGLAGVPASRVAAILVGHSHHDHLSDVPFVLREIAPSARIFVNDSGARLLAPWKLGDRVVSLEPRPGELNRLEGLPIRFLAVRTGHAPTFLRYHFRSGQVARPLTKPAARVRVRDFKAGTPMAFVIDLLSPDSRQVAFRIYYQDAPNPEGLGAPPDFVREDGRAFDLAILCAASYNWVKQAPEWILGKVRPRHVLVSHYDDFFRSRRKTGRFVPLLTGSLANGYVSRVDATFQSLGLPSRGPEGEVCGPSGPRWTMPVVGKRIRFVPASQDSR